MTIEEAGSPTRREEGSSAGCLALQSGRKSLEIGDHIMVDKVGQSGSVLLTKVEE